MTPEKPQPQAPFLQVCDDLEGLLTENLLVLQVSSDLRHRVLPVDRSTYHNLSLLKNYPRGNGSHTSGLVVA